MGLIQVYGTAAAARVALRHRLRLTVEFQKSSSRPENPTVDPTGVFNGGVSRKSASQPTSLQPEDPIVGSTTDNLAQSLKGESQDIDIVIRQAGSQRGAEEATSAVPTMSQLESNGSKDDMGCAQS